MDMATWAVLIAAGALLMNFTDKVFGGGARLSSRLTTIETSVIAMQEEINRLVETMSKIADMPGDIRVSNMRLLAAEQDLRQRRHGESFVRGPRVIDGEYP